MDFVDHYRAEGRDYDTGWEERWVRDEGYLKIVPRAVTALLERTGIAAADIAHFVMPTDQGTVPGTLVKQFGMPGTAVTDNLLQTVGSTGAAHPLVLERPNPGLNEVLVFSPYLIHGGAFNQQTDATRVSLEMRFWRVR